MYERRTFTKDQLRKIQQYINVNKETLEAICYKTGAYFGINGSFYLYDKWVPTCPTIVSGVVVAESSDNYWGFQWNDKDVDVALSSAITKSNFMSNIMMVRDGQKRTMYYNEKSVGGNRGRSIWSLYNDYMEFVCFNDGDSHVTDPLGAQNSMYVAGAIQSELLDGGLSSHCWMDGAYLIPPARTRQYVENYILVYLKPSSSVPIKQAMVTAIGLKKRVGPSTKYAAVGTPFDKGAIVDVYEIRNNWGCTKDCEWFSLDYATLIEDEPTKTPAQQVQEKFNLSKDDVQYLGYYKDSAALLDKLNGGK